MPRSCVICTHAQRAAIDAAIVALASFRDIAGQYRVSKSAVARHKEAHLPADLTRAATALAVAHADDLLAQIQALHARTLTILKGAEEAGAFNQALSAIREARTNLELLARLEGKLKEQQTINILLLPEWQTIRAVLVGALSDEPSARIKVAAALRAIDGR